MTSVQEAILSVRIRSSADGSIGFNSGSAPTPTMMPPWLDFGMVHAEIKANKAALDDATAKAVDVAMAAAAQPRKAAEAARDDAQSELAVLKHESEAAALDFVATMAQESAARAHADAAAASATAELVHLRAQLAQRETSHSKLRLELAALKRTAQTAEFERDCAATKAKAFEKTSTEVQAELKSSNERLMVLAKVDMAVAAAGVDLDNLNGETVLAAVKGLSSDELLKVLNSALESIGIDLGTIVDSVGAEGNSPTKVIADLLDNGALKAAAFSVVGSGFLGDKLQSMGEDGSLSSLIDSIATPEAMARLEQLVAVGITIASAPPSARMDALVSDESLGILKEMCVSGAFGSSIQKAVGANGARLEASKINPFVHFFSRESA